MRNLQRWLKKTKKNSTNGRLNDKIGNNYYLRYDASRAPSGLQLPSYDGMCNTLSGINTPYYATQAHNVDAITVDSTNNLFQQQPNVRFYNI